MYIHTSLLIHRDWNEATLQEATCLLSEELQLPADVPGGMPEYRKSLVTSFFFKFFLTVSHLLSPHSLPPQLQSATQPYTRSAGTIFLEISLFVCCMKNHDTPGLWLGVPRGFRECHRVRKLKIRLDGQLCSYQLHNRPLERPGILCWILLVPRDTLCTRNKLAFWLTR